MYVPRHLIETNLYTNGGEYILSTTRTNYRGHYWRDAQNNYYTGRTPDETPRVQLIPSVPEMDDSESHSGITTAQATWITDYNSPITKTPPGRQPVKYRSNPTQEQVEFGEFQRYFVKKANQLIYFEVNKEEHDLIVGEDSSMLYQLYVPISIPWQLDGTLQEAYEVNKGSAARVRLPGFVEFFKDNFTQFHQSRLDNNQN